jgi:hypothetical protein
MRHFTTKGDCIRRSNISHLSYHLSYRDCGVWEALDVSGRGTAPAKPALYVGVVDE